MGGSTPDQHAESDGLLTGSKKAVINYGEIVTLQSEQFRSYVGADSDSVNVAPSPQAYEKWLILNADDITSTSPVDLSDRVILKSLRFDRFLGADVNNNLKMAATSGSWEQWQLGDREGWQEGAVLHNSVITLRQYNDDFAHNPYISMSPEGMKLAGNPDSWERFIIARWEIDISETQTRSLRFGDVINLVSDYNKNYLSADGNYQVFGSRYPQRWEQWKLINPDNTASGEYIRFNQKVALYSTAFDAYLSGRNDLSIGLSPNMQEWEEWFFINDEDTGSDERVTFEDLVNLQPARFAEDPQYLKTDLDNAAGLSANRMEWERWRIRLWPRSVSDETLHYGDIITLRSRYFNSFAGADAGTTASDLPQAWEQWRVINPDDAASTDIVRLSRKNDTEQSVKMLLHSRDFNRYLSGNPDGMELSLSQNQNGYEKWSIVSLSGGEGDPVSMRYISALALADYQNRFLSSTRTELKLAEDINDWEKWDILQTWVSPSRWMKHISGENVLTQLTIPGTHDSGTYTYGDIPFVSTQTENISSQLESGVRFLDIRAMKSGNPNYNGRLYITHGLSMLISDLSLAEVIDACKAFLADNPSETILFSLKKDADPDIDMSNHNTFYEQFVQDHYNTDTNIWYTGNRIPRLRDVRGKIVLFSRSGMDGNLGIRLSFKDNSVEGRYPVDGVSDQWYEVEDRYQPVTDSGKKDAVLWHIQRAQEDLSQQGHLSTMWITFTSANIPSEGKGPKYYALSGGFWPFKWLNINGWLKNTIIPENGPMGVIPMDFPDKDLVSRLLRSNSYCYNDCSEYAESQMRNLHLK